ncbi:MAG: LamG-like jellyroll fold domain-containing protein, partial [Pseudomonadota bacterium]
MRMTSPRLAKAAFCIFFLSGIGYADDAELSVPFESLESLPGDMVITTQFEQPDHVPGVSGRAWRTDGFSSWASAPVNLGGTNSFSVATWVALESYPSDLEVVVSRLSPSSIINQRKGSKGFDIFIDTYGRWGLWLATSRGDIRIDAPDNFPLYAWAHVAAVVDTSARKATLYLNGQPIGTGKLSKNSEIEFAETELVLARSHKDVGFLNFTFNFLNAAYDEFSIYRHALNEDQVHALATKFGEPPNGMASLVVPDTRFANDHLRPRYRGMPPANWTNEPHGLVRRGDTWHLFYQRTPNGPYKTQMHWGHMASDDLVSWRHLPDALWPELQDDKFGFDQKGIWSGDVIIDGDSAYAFYTSVNHFHRLTASNPGVSMAVSTDPDLATWKKLGPVVNTEHVNDFRDPYLWREGNSWHMIIGADIDTGGGLDYYVLEPGKKGATWTHRDRFSAVSYRLLDYGSIIWEMPVFEPLTDDVHILVVNPIGGRVSKYGDPATRGVYW